MPGITQEQHQKIEAAVAEALKDDGPERATVAVESVGIADIKDLFCKNWATVKSVLQFISGYLPVYLRVAVAAVIKVGDGIHAAIC